MVFDPLSIIGYFGTTLGIISFLAGTVENVDAKRRNYIQIQLDLEQHRNSFRLAHQLYLSWTILWTKDGLEHYSPDDYKYLWGKSGYDEVQKNLEVVEKRMMAVREILAVQGKSTRRSECT